MSRSERHPTTGVARIFLLALCASACTQDNDGAVSDVIVPVLHLGQPTLEIGTIDGAEDYVFAALETVLRLPDGTVAVSDAGASRISIFDASGEINRRTG